MAEEIEEGAVKEVNMNSALNALNNMAAHNAYKPSEELSEMVEKKFSAETTEEKTKVEEVAETTETVAETTETKVDETKEEETFIESEIFGGKVKLNKEKEEEQEIKVENLEELNSHLKEQFGIEDISTLGKQINTWKEQEKTLGEISTKLTNAEKLFESMPSDLYQLVQLHVNGADWKQGLTNPSLNFEKSVDDYKVEELIDVLFPGKVSEDDWEEYRDEDGDAKTKKMVDVLIEQAKSKFVETKKGREELSKNAIENAKKQEERFEKSVEASSKKLSSQIEGIDSNYIKSIEKQLKTPGGIYEIFFDKDGVLKEDAALAFAMAKDGYNLLDQYKKLIQTKTETKVNQELLLRGSSTPTGSRGSQSAEKEIRPEVQAKIDSIRRMAQKP